MSLSGKRIVLGVTGSIAAYKSAELVRAFTKAGATVRVVMSPSAREFVSPLTLQTLSGNPVYDDLFSLVQESEIGHIELADNADVYVIAPCTAHTLARLAGGFADEPVSTVALATQAPVLIAPAMNVNMWNHPATQENIATLKARDIQFVEPGTGELACKWIGKGRLADLEAIVQGTLEALVPQDLEGLHFVVNAGPTREHLDPARYLSNPSTGKMGYACAQAAASRGATVTLVSGPTALEVPVGVQRVQVVSAREMHRATMDAMVGADVAILSAAVADFRFASPSGEKKKKRELGENPSLQLEANPDILADVAANFSKAYVVGFAAETTSPVEQAREKLRRKGANMIVCNDISKEGQGFGADTNAVVLVTEENDEALPLDSKLAIAHGILNRIRGTFA